MFLDERKNGPGNAHQRRIRRRALRRLNQLAQKALTEMLDPKLVLEEMQKRDTLRGKLPSGGDSPWPTLQVGVPIDFRCD